MSFGISAGLWKAVAVASAEQAQADRRPLAIVGLGGGAALLLLAGLPGLFAFAGSFDGFFWLVLLGVVGVSFVGTLTGSAVALQVTSPDSLGLREFGRRCLVAGLWGVSFSPVVLLLVLAALLLVVLGTFALHGNPTAYPDLEFSPVLVGLAALPPSALLVYLAARWWFAISIMALEQQSIWRALAASWRATRALRVLAGNLGTATVGAVWILGSVLAAIYASRVALFLAGIVGMVLIPLAQVGSATAYDRVRRRVKDSHPDARSTGPVSAS